MTAAARIETPPGLAPFSLKDAPSFIERQFPVGRHRGPAALSRSVCSELQRDIVPADV